MPRIPFEPGFEALAADMMTLQNATIVRYDTEQQRDADWPDPFTGALCFIAGPVDLLQIYWGNGWRTILYNVDTAARVFIGSKFVPNAADTTYPIQFELQLASTGAYILYRPTAGVSTTKQVFFASASSGGGTYRIHAPSRPNEGVANSFVVDTKALDLYLYTWNLELAAEPGERSWMALGRDPARTNRVKLTVAGNVSADNLPANLMERLANLESRLAEAEARLAIVDAPTLPDEHDAAAVPPLATQPEESE